MPIRRVTAAAATAAALLALAACGSQPTSTEDPTSSPGGSNSTPTSPTEEVPSTPTDTAASPTTTSTAAGRLAVYYLGDTSHGTRLFREWRPTDVGDTGARVAAAGDLVAEQPLDPDYRTPWQAGDLAEATLAADGIEVTLTDPGLQQRPAGLSARDARMAVQQVVYTLQAAAQERMPVRFLVSGEPASQVLGVATAEPVTAADPLRVLSLVNVFDPVEGAKVRGERLRVTGAANSFEATVVWRILAANGDPVAGPDSFMATGWGPGRLFPFHGVIDVADLPAGRYVLEVSTDDPSGGAEGNGPFVDTRTIVVS